MKRGLLICLVGLAVLLLPTLANGAKSGWSDQGSGTPAGTSETWQWSASSDVGGANVSGHFSEKNAATNTYFSGDVFCLSVFDPTPGTHTARIGVLITNTNEPTRPLGSWTYFTMKTNDGSNPVNMVGADVSHFGPLPPCPPPSGFISPFNGTINIRP